MCLGSAPCCVHLLAGLTKAVLVSRKESGSAIEEVDKTPAAHGREHRAVVGHMLPQSVHW